MKDVIRIEGKERDQRRVRQVRKERQIEGRMESVIDSEKEKKREIPRDREM